MAIIKAGTYRWVENPDFSESYAVTPPDFQITVSPVMVEDEGESYLISVDGYFNSMFVAWSKDDEVIPASSVYFLATDDNNVPRMLINGEDFEVIQALPVIENGTPSEVAFGLGQEFTVENDVVITDEYVDTSAETDSRADAFANWFKANTIAVTGGNTTTITYGGVSTEVEAGKKATLVCNGKKMTSDVVIAFESNGTITYNGSVTSVVSGKTATLRCAGKRMKGDVSIAQ